jgi:hypothetical protein
MLANWQNYPYRIFNKTKTLKILKKDKLNFSTFVFILVKGDFVILLKLGLHCHCFGSLGGKLSLEW